MKEKEIMYKQDWNQFWVLKPHGKYLSWGGLPYKIARTVQKTNCQDNVPSKGLNIHSYLFMHRTEVDKSPLQRTVNTYML